MLIDILKNSEVYSVIFIQDYLQLYFEGEQHNATLTVYSFPMLLVKGEYIEIGMAGYRDALCSFINHQVKRLELESGQSLELTFDNDDKIEVSLKKLNGQEAAMLRVENEITIW